MPLLRGTRPLKQWCYVLFAAPELAICAAEAKVLGVPRRWWALATPAGELRGVTGATRRRLRIAPERVAICGEGETVTIEIEPRSPVEVASPEGRDYIWTRKRVGPARAEVAIAGECHTYEGYALVDESAGYHRRRTVWRWSAGIGDGTNGETLAWNLVAGIHDDERASERTVWIDGVAHETEPVQFDSDLRWVRSRSGCLLEFEPWAERREQLSLGFVRVDYRQPFGAFRGTLPGAIELVRGVGVMESHDARW